MAQMVGRGAGRRLESLKGQYIVDNWRGRIRIRAWPKKKPTKPTTGQQQQRNRFKEAIEAAKRMDPAAQNWARDLAAGSQLLPRDLLLKLLYGRMFVIVMPDGRKIHSMASRNDASYILDTIGQTQGDILTRGEDWWEIIPIGNDGQVLTSRGPGLAPVWAEPPGEGGYYFTGGTSLGAGQRTGGTRKCQGGFWSPKEPFNILSIGFGFDGITSGHGFTPQIVRLADEGGGSWSVDEILWTGTEKVAGTGDATIVTWDVDITVALQAGSHYGLYLSNTLYGAGGSEMDIWSFTGANSYYHPNAPIEDTAPYIAFDTELPPVGTVAASISTGLRPLVFVTGFTVPEE